jgi:hypothetical protein
MSLVPLDGSQTYVMSAGTHVFWIIGALYPHALIPHRLHFYVLRVELLRGERYLLKEDVNTMRVILITAITGKVETTAELLDEPWVFMKGCKWD